MYAISSEPTTAGRPGAETDQSERSDSEAQKSFTLFEDLSDPSERIKMDDHSSSARINDVSSGPADSTPRLEAVSSAGDTQGSSGAIAVAIQAIAQSMEDALKGLSMKPLPRDSVRTIALDVYASYVEEFETVVRFTADHLYDFVDAATFEPHHEHWRFQRAPKNYSEIEATCNRTILFTSAIDFLVSERSDHKYSELKGYLGFGFGPNYFDLSTLTRSKPYSVGGKSRYTNPNASNAQTMREIMHRGYLSKRVPFGFRAISHQPDSYGQNFMKLVHDISSERTQFMRNFVPVQGEIIPVSEYHKLENPTSPIQTQLITWAIERMRPSRIRLTSHEILFLIDEFALLHEMDTIQLLQVYCEYADHRLSTESKTFDNPHFENILNYRIDALMFLVYRTNMDLKAISLCLESSPEYAPPALRGTILRV